MKVAFSVKNSESTLGVKSIGEGNDCQVYAIYFRPPIPFSNTRECLLETESFSLPLINVEAPHEVHILDRTYMLFPTHELIFERGNSNTVLGMFIQIMYTSLPHVSTALYFLPQLLGADRFRDTVFFPFDVDPSKYRLRIDPRTIPQRTPLWFKFRGPVTGTKMYTLLGFWVPTMAQDPTWTLDGPKVFTAFQKANMRLGSESEEYALLLYLHAYDTTRAEMIGWCNVPRTSGLPSDWGCSPDGLLIDNALGWDDMPSGYKELFPLLDPRRGALEIKSSKTSLSMQAYFIPQVYMEMICLETMWCDIVRYRHGHTARVYRIFRDVRLERDMLELVKYAREHSEQLQHIVQEPRFIQMRQRLEGEARRARYKELRASDELLGVFRAYDGYANNLFNKRQ